MTNDDYTIEDGIIRSPGKFEGEPAYAPYFWDAVLNGCCDHEFQGADEFPVVFFVVKAEDRREFPELANVYGLALTEDSRGFIYCTTFEAAAEYGAALDEYMHPDEAEDAGGCDGCGRSLPEGEYCPRCNGDQYLARR